MKVSIKVLYIVASPALYGSNKALINLLEHIDKRFIRPVVIMSSKGPLTAYLKEHGIENYILNFDYSVYPDTSGLKNIILYLPRLLKTIIINTFAISSIVKISKKNHIDLIHTNVSPLHVGYKAAMKLGIPHVWHIREYQDLYYNWKPIFSRKSFERKLNGECNYTIAITKDLFRHYSLSNNSKVITDGVMSRGDIQFNPNKEKYFLFIGRLEVGKGIVELLLSFKLLVKVNTEYKLLVVGDGSVDFKQHLLTLVEDLKLTDYVSFLGYQHEINPLLANATALIVPSSNEGFGFTTVEALFNGCLVIGKDSGGTSEILREKDIGILYKTKEGLAKKMTEVITGGIHIYFPRINLGQNIAKSKYSCENHAIAISSFYVEVLKKSKSNIKY